MLAVILVGGRSSRMGRDKAMLTVDGKPMARLLAERFAAAGYDTVFSVDRAGRFLLDGACELEDAFPGQGPLNGLYAAFTRTDAPCILLMGTDLPAVEPALAKHLEALRGDHDACMIRRSDGTVETLFGVYSRSCFPAAAECLREGRRSMRSMLDKLCVRYVDEAELPEWDIPWLLQNVNTPEAFAEFLSARGE